MTSRTGDVRNLLAYAKGHGATVQRCSDGWTVRLDGRRIATVHRSPSRSAVLAARQDIDRGLRRRHSGAGL